MRVRKLLEPVGTRLIELPPHACGPVDLILVRHGQTTWNVERRIMGARPVPLSDQGRQQVCELARNSWRWDPLEIVSSPVLRAVQTAGLLAEQLSVQGQVRSVSGLVEFDMGQWEERRVSELRGQKAWEDYLEFPEQTHFPGGESMQGIQQRAVRCVNALLAQTTAAGLVCVTHGGIVRLLVLAAYGAPLSSYHRSSVPTGSMSVIRLRPGGRPVVRCVGVTGDTGRDW